MTVQEIVRQPQLSVKQVLHHMYEVQEEFNALVEEFEILSNPKLVKQLEHSHEAERAGTLESYDLEEFKKEIGL